jgi:hypothetical protein
MTEFDLHAYMTRVGQQARAASRAMARASTADKNRALLTIAAAIRRDAASSRPSTPATSNAPAPTARTPPSSTA